jgi:hypothetical protein
LAQPSIPCKHTGAHAWRQAAALKKLWNATRSKNKNAGKMPAPTRKKYCPA